MPTYNIGSSFTKANEILWLRKAVGIFYEWQRMGK